MLFSLIMGIALILTLIGLIVLCFCPEKPLLMSNEANNTKPTGFWKRQFKSESTSKQRFFDWTFGVILPVICFTFDPAIFKGAISHNGAILGEYKPFAYLLSYTSIVLMMLFLLYGQKLGWFNAVLAGLFTVGSAVSLIVGIILLPLSLLGLIILVGVLGFTPLLTAFVYARNSIRAFSFADEHLISKTLLINLFAVSAIFSFVLPYVFYTNVESLLRKMENGSPTEVREEKNKLQYFSPLINVDRLASKSCGSIDNESKTELRQAVYELSGKNADEISRQYCNDW